MSTPSYPYSVKDLVDFYPMRGEPISKAPDETPVKGRITYVGPTGKVNIYCAGAFGKDDSILENVPMVLNGQPAYEYGYFAMPSGATYTPYVAPAAPSAPTPPATLPTDDTGTEDMGVGTTPKPEDD